jgi:hypothetical protein
MQNQSLLESQDSQENVLQSINKVKVKHRPEAHKMR